MKRRVQYHLELWAFRILGAVAFISLGILAVVVLRQQGDIADTSVRNCRDSRTLISRIVLRTSGATYDDYKKDPEGVLRRYRVTLLSFQAYREDPRLLDTTLKNTRETLEEADPARCRRAPVEP